MFRAAWLLTFAALVAPHAVAQSAPADAPSARVVRYFGYDKAVELRLGEARAVLCPEAGGRVLEFSVGDHSALYLSDEEKAWRASGGTPAPSSAGRFDFGPELTVVRHPAIWSGQWTAEVTGASSAKLTSPRDEASGVQLVREFALKSESDGDTSSAQAALPHLVCRQTMINISPDRSIEVCHWGRSFSPGGGICLVPLGDRPSRFPAKYVMYEDRGVINTNNEDQNIRERDGFIEILAPPRKPKLGFDSCAGWLAYVMPSDTLFVKRFATYPDRVYNEAAALTLSVWYPPSAMIELEPIGPRERLAPGERASFTETWWLLPFAFPKEGESIELDRLNELVLRSTSSD